MGTALLDYFVIIEDLDLFIYQLSRSQFTLFLG
ncbi:hypothetical protein Pse7429DRAFT_2390 [Pseudanabaena biceps PCC 7429]|uniref:Uncharacterized protein n=1 Tax=Pseudanabaena biceps PCC 7429 TaxID=927668 RepID=L8MX53_9CYAN|nr:hypothetical protein Pse7429DRAFT_2390 [Pseudanabaena biceps PCC 7429]